METIKQAVKSVADTATAVFNDAKIADLKHFTVDDSAKGNKITTDFGTRITDTDNTLKAGVRGPTLIEDFHFREKITHFDHERIPERVVHARGSGAHGYFQVYESMQDYTKADFLNHPQKKTPVFVRFSTVLGSRGSADTVRDVRGFAIKFYTDEGNFDLVGNNIPVFFIQDAIKFPDIIHAGKPEPNTEIPQAQTAHDNFWDFVSLTPESTHMLMWTLSDRAIPRSYRMMEGFGVHTFVLVNNAGKRRFVKFHIIPSLGVNSLVWDEAVKLQGVDPDFHRRDLADAIAAGAYPEWDFAVQIVEEEDENKFDFDILDATKIIPEELVPLKRIGKLVLNRNPDNFFAETEQIAFCTQHLVPGIEASLDPLLQGRLFSYLDTQLTRLGGPNFQEIPINRPVCPVTNNQRDGFHRMTINKPRVNYFPNRFGCPALATMQEGGYANTPQPVTGTVTRGPRPAKFAEHYSQARLFFNSMSAPEKEHLLNAAKFELGHVDDVAVRERQVHNFNKVDHAFAVDLANAIGVKPPAPDPAGQTHSHMSPALSQQHYPSKEGIKSRKVAILIGPGFKKTHVALATAALTASGAVPMNVGPHKGPIPDDSGTSVDAQFSFLTTKSVMFDAILIVGGQKSIQALDMIGEAIAFVYESFKHCKPIGALEDGVDLLRTLNLPGIAVATDDKVVIDQGVVTARDVPANVHGAKETGDFMTAFINSIDAHRHWQRNVKRIAI